MAFKILKARENFDVQEGYSEAVTYSYKDKSIRLSKVDFENKYDKNGNYPEKVWVEWENWRAHAIGGLLSFNPIVSFPEVDLKEYDRGELYYQLSNDNGEKYYYWDGTKWALVTDTDNILQWNTSEDIDENISTFPLIYESQYETVQVKPRVLLVSGGKYRKDGTHDRLLTPYIQAICFTVRYYYDTFMDLCNSVQKYIENNLKARFSIRFLCDKTAKEFTANTLFTNLEEFLVFNLTTDPNRNINLLDKIDGNVVKLTDTITEDDTIEFVFSGSCPVLLQEDSELVEANIPFIVIRGVDKETEKNMGTYEGTYYLPKISSDYSYVGKEARWSNSIMRIVCVSENVGTSTFMAGAVSALFEHNRVIQSLATGDYFYIMDVKPYEDASNVEKGGNKKLLYMTLLYQDWARDGKEENIEKITNITKIKLGVELIAQQSCGDLAVEEDVIEYDKDILD